MKDQDQPIGLMMDGRVSFTETVHRRELSFDKGV